MLACAKSQKGFIMAIRFDGDESEDKEGKIHAIAGFIGFAEEWDRLQEEWIDRVEPNGVRVANSPINTNPTGCVSSGGVMGAVGTVGTVGFVCDIKGFCCPCCLIASPLPVSSKH